MVTPVCLRPPPQQRAGMLRKAMETSRENIWAEAASPARQVGQSSCPGQDAAWDGVVREDGREDAADC
eukprot:855114-Rhodomonas_salina.1